MEYRTIMVLVGVLVVLALLVLPALAGGQHPRTRGIGCLVALALALVAGITISYRALQDTTHRELAREAASRAELVRDSRPTADRDALEPLEADNHPAAREAGAPEVHREAGNDLVLWRESDVLGFEPVAPGGTSAPDVQAGRGGALDLPARWWEDAAGSRRRTHRSGETGRPYWEPGEGGLLAGYSPPQASAEEARREARRAVQEKVAMLGLLRLEKQRPGIGALAAPGSLALAVKLAEPGGKYLEELAWRLEHAHRAYGTIWRAAVLVRAAPQRIDRLAELIEVGLRNDWAREFRQRRFLVLAAAAVIVAGFALFLLYVFLNAGTRGYFAWPLRLVSGAIFLAVVAVVACISWKLGTG